MSKTPVKMRRIKLSEIVTNGLLDRIRDDNMAPGDRLPKEVQLMEEFGCSKSTLREALKSLENQGLIIIETGPKGGARLLNVSYNYANKSLRNYFRFKDLDSQMIFEARGPLELTLCESVIGNISDETFEELEKILENARTFLNTPDLNIEVWRLRRQTEIAFNSLIAQVSPNPIIGFLCQFVNDLISDTIVDNYLYFHPTTKEEYGKIAFDNLERYFHCLKNEDREGALDCVQERMDFISVALKKVEVLSDV